MSPVHAPADYFRDLSARVFRHVSGQERVALFCRGEDSTFVRFARSTLRQPGRVEQCEVTLTLSAGARATSLRASMTGDLDRDASVLIQGLSDMRGDLSWLPDDPHLLLPDRAESSHDEGNPRAEAPSIDPHAVCDAVLRLGAGLDLTGLLASGEIYAGFADTRGQWNWFARSPMHLDFSLHAERPGTSSAALAVKGSLAGYTWDEAHLAARLEAMRAHLDVLARPARTLAPDEYRAFLAPAAMEELLGVVSWSGFGARARQTRQSALQRMADDDARLHPEVTLLEASASGAGPRFGPQGFLVPPRVDLVRAGRLADPLVSPRSAREYGLATTGSSPDEAPTSLEMAPGSLPASEALAALGTGLYVGNLWYLNFSDLQACRITGMTRFATFWVEDGKLVAPITPMRFDDTLYRMWGSHLEALTREREWMLDATTYEARSTRSTHLPGALVSAFRCTL